MKELKFSAEISGVPPEVIFQVLYFDKDFLTRYHTEVNEDPDAKASAWTEDDTRTVIFQTPLSARAWVAKALGADTLRICEEQTITHKTKDLYIVESIPKLDIKGGERFKTGGQVELRPSEKEAGTAITMVARMECALWPLGSTIETIMAEQATSSFENWLRILKTICQEKVGLFGDGSDSEDLYFDVTEESLPEEVFSDSEITGEETDSWYLRTILKELRLLRSTTENADSKLASLEARIARLEESVQTQGRRKGASLVSHIVPRSDYVGWAGLIGAFSVGALSAAHLYVKAHRFL